MTEHAEQARALADDEFYRTWLDDLPAEPHDVSASVEVSSVALSPVVFDRVPHWHGKFDKGTIEVVWRRIRGEARYYVYFSADDKAAIKPAWFKAPDNLKPQGRLPDAVVHTVLVTTGRQKWRLLRFHPAG